MNKYHKNFILCGEIDYLCVLCKESFQDTSEVEKHIRWEMHRKLIKQQSYFPKFRKDSVYQIGKIFYCEVCNYATETIDSIKEHLAEESHKTHIQNPQNVIKTENKTIKRFGEVVTISKMVLTKEEWLGVTNKQCWVCQMEITSSTKEHIFLVSHLVNLIQTQIIEVNNEYYRKLNETTAYCFECKKIIPIDELSIHSSDHQKDQQKRKNNVTKTKGLYNIDRENNMATCKKCNETMELHFSKLYHHKTVHQKDTKHDSVEEMDEIGAILQDYDHGKQRADLKKYGKDNHLKLNSGGRKGYCNLCGTYVSPHIANFKEHVNGARHIGNLELRGLMKTNKKPEKVYYTTKPYSYFFPDIVLLKDPLIAIINMKFCLDVLSLMFLCPLEIDGIGKKNLKCYLCDKLISFNDLAHYSRGHREDILKTKVITNISGEFIREVRPGLYHCGFCNSVYPSWKLLEKHLRSWVHRNWKIQWQLKMEKMIEHSVYSSRQEYREFIESIDILD